MNFKSTLRIVQNPLRWAEHVFERRWKHAKSAINCPDMAQKKYRLSRKTRTCKDGCTYLRGELQVLARRDASTCEDGCSALRGRMQCTARTDAVHCRGGCSALRGRMQCTAGADAVHCGGGCSALRLRWVKTGVEIASPILDKRKGRRDPP